MTSIRQVVRALIARAMYHFHAGAWDSGWQDVLTCIRLGRLLSQGGTILEVLLGIAAESVTERALLTYLQQAPLSAAELRQRLTTLQTLPPRPSLARPVGLSERVMFLEVMQRIAKEGPIVIDQLISLQRNTKKSVTETWIGKEKLLANLKWESALQIANQRYDRLVQILQVPDPVARRQQLHQFNLEIEEQIARFRAPNEKMVHALITWELFMGAKPRTETVGDILARLLTPTFKSVNANYEFGAQHFTNCQVAFALALFKQEHGHFPDSLAKLTPNYLAETPTDIFAAAPLYYQVTDDGFLLYSVGKNGKDDTKSSATSQANNDDITVRWPLLPVTKTP